MHRCLAVQDKVKHRLHLYENNKPGACTMGVHGSFTIALAGKGSVLFHSNPQSVFFLCDFY